VSSTIWMASNSLRKKKTFYFQLWFCHHHHKTIQLNKFCRRIIQLLLNSLSQFHQRFFARVFCMKVLSPFCRPNVTREKLSTFVQKMWAKNIDEIDTLTVFVDSNKIITNSIIKYIDIHNHWVKLKISLLFKYKIYFIW